MTQSLEENQAAAEHESTHGGRDQQHADEPQGSEDHVRERGLVNRLLDDADDDWILLL